MIDLLTRANSWLNGLVWDIADTLNGLMAIPNLISVLWSIPLLMRLTREFFKGAAPTASA